MNEWMDGWMDSREIHKVLSGKGRGQCFSFSSPIAIPTYAPGGHLAAKAARVTCDKITISYGTWFSKRCVSAILAAVVALTSSLRANCT